MENPWSLQQALLAIRAAYAALDIRPTRDRAVINRAFREAAQTWHPDKHPESRREECESRFKALVGARDVCLEASGVERLMHDIQSGEGVEHFHTGDPTAPGPCSEHEATHTQAEAVDEEWKIFVDQPAAYFNLFAMSSSTLVVMLLVSLLSGAITVAGVSVFVVGAVILMGVSLILSALAISIPVFGWIALAMAGLYAAAQVGQAAQSGFTQLRTFVGTELAKTAFPHKSLRFTWWAANILPIALAVPAMTETSFGLVAVYLIVSNLCFWMLAESLGQTLARIEAEYDAIRKRHTEPALVLRSRQRIGPHS